jgi:hypothetical protein
MNTFKILALTLLFSAVSFSTQAQMNQEPWGFKQQDRATTAAMMHQVEGGSTNDPPAMICGGAGGKAGATANSTCIILNHSTGNIDLDQTSEGDQSASNDDDSDADDVLDALKGK